MDLIIQVSPRSNIFCEVSASHTTFNKWNGKEELIAVMKERCSTYHTGFSPGWAASWTSLSKTKGSINSCNACNLILRRKNYYAAIKHMQGSIWLATEIERFAISQDPMMDMTCRRNNFFIPQPNRLNKGNFFLSKSSFPLFTPKNSIGLTVSRLMMVSVNLFLF